MSRSLVSAPDEPSSPPSEAALASSPLSELIPIWEASLRARNRSPKTIRSYGDTARLLAEYLESAGLSTQVDRISREQIESFINDQLARWRPGTAALRYRSLKPLFAWLVDREIILVSPMARMRTPKVPEHPVPVVSDDVLIALLATCASKQFEDIRDKALLRVMIDTGARLGEVTGIQLSGLDLESGVVAVLGKGHRSRVVPFGPKTWSALVAYLDLRRGHEYSGKSALWLTVKGALTTSGISQMLRRRCRRAGVAAIHPHQFRHTAAHNWLALGGSEGDAMRLFGWRSREMLSRYGAALAEERALSAYRRLNPGERV